MSWNVRYDTLGDGENMWELRKPLFLDALKRQTPSVAGLQEVYQSQLFDILNYLNETVEAGRYNYVGVGRDDGDTRGEYSPIVYDQKNYERLDSGHFWLSSTPNEPSRNFDSHLRRIVTWLSLRHRSTSRRFFFLNTHWDHASASARQKSAQLIESYLRDIEIDLDQYTVMLLGDLNAVEDTREVKRLRDFGFHDTFRLLHRTERVVGTHHGFRGRLNGGKIDYILIKPQENMENVTARLNLTSATIVREKYDGDLWPSDHFAVTATFKIQSVVSQSNSPSSSAFLHDVDLKLHLLLSLVIGCYFWFLG